MQAMMGELFSAFCAYAHGTTGNDGNTLIRHLALLTDSVRLLLF
jgi:hypothetical protein